MELTSNASCKLAEIGQCLKSNEADADVQRTLQIISRAQAVEQGNIERLERWLGATAGLKLENEVLKAEISVLKQENNRIVNGLRLRNEALTAENTALKKEVQEGALTLERCLDTAIADSARFREEYSLLVKQLQDMKGSYDALADMHQSLLQEHQSLIAKGSLTSKHSIDDEAGQTIAEEPDVIAGRAQLCTDTWDDLGELSDDSVDSDLSAGGMSESAQTDTSSPRRLPKAGFISSCPSGSRLTKSTPNLSQLRFPEPSKICKRPQLPNVITHVVHQSQAQGN